MDGKSSFSKDIMPGANVSWYLRSGQLSVTAVYRKGEESEMLRTGFDGRFCIKGIDVFAEVAYGMQDKGEDTGRSSEIAVIGGTVIPLGKSLIGVYARLFPSDFPKDLAGAVRSGTSVRDESGLSLSFQRKSMTFCADYSKKLSTSRNQLKLTLKDEIPVGKVFSIKPRAVVRLRSGAEDARVDVRSDFVLGTGPWTNVLRGEWLRCEEDAFLTYYESGYKIDEFSVYGRATFFRVDRWADRIYAYQRDAPGNFNVPAYYGRGYGLDLYTAWKKSLGRFTRLKLYFRAYMLSYPWTKMSGQVGHDGTRKKPGKGGLSFQVAFDF